ncbi:TPA: transcriptional regulator [Salmonella enterica subsp. indica]|uniref:Transcriptional regulator n=3 Tax=Salmonella enterica TaxID=28901 RepID=A0A5Y2QLW3_SALER|nr:transcriptional regulator [Salmonella enterica]EBH9036608.1 transcriptional regulator [Salmonella enterica subsp. indica serovar 11:b:e,n,x]EBP3213466.1 transcriptional regulator [Salmonella enterica subsp. arizonae]EEM2501690.1 transcriptional regulator [Salmonella enterica subsp. indica serovar 45:a:e,n,x]HAC6564379.1 transcriptional regulator [Salmonella enterica subsp. indica]HAE8195193.1 transcriptional regulator [Salmonella enterica subsp. indica serovar 41:b:1,7]HCM1934465.1 transcr
MTEHNQMPARQIIVYGDCWPVTIAVAHLVRTFLSGSNCETAYRLPILLQHLRRKPEAILILCLRPREHLFLFYALRQTLPDYPVMIISDELFFSDWLVLKVYGGIPALLEQELAEKLIHARRGEPWSVGARLQGTEKLESFLLSPAPVTGFLEVPPIFNNPKRLMNYMDQLMHREILACGVSQAQLRLLQEVYRGRGRLSALCGRLNTQEKQIWQDKYRLLVKLGMRNRLRELLFGTRFCKSLQRTPFIAPQ